jgi:hypothetical protein
MWTLFFTCLNQQFPWIVAPSEEIKSVTFILESCFSDGARDGPASLATHFSNVDNSIPCDIKPKLSQT